MGLKVRDQPPQASQDAGLTIPTTTARATTNGLPFQLTSGKPSCGGCCIPSERGAH